MAMRARRWSTMTTGSLCFCRSKPAKPMWSNFRRKRPNRPSNFDELLDGGGGFNPRPSVFLGTRFALEPGSADVFEKKYRRGLRRIDRLVMARHRNQHVPRPRNHLRSVGLAPDHQYRVIEKSRRGKTAFPVVRVGETDRRKAQFDRRAPQFGEVLKPAQRQRELRPQRRTDRLVAEGIDRPLGVPEFGEPHRAGAADNRAEIAGIPQPVDRKDERVAHRGSGGGFLRNPG